MMTQGALMQVKCNASMHQVREETKTRKQRGGVIKIMVASRLLNMECRLLDGSGAEVTAEEREGREQGHLTYNRNSQE